MELKRIALIGLGLGAVGVFIWKLTQKTQEWAESVVEEESEEFREELPGIAIEEIRKRAPSVLVGGEWGLGEEAEAAISEAERELEYIESLSPKEREDYLKKKQAQQQARALLRQLTREKEWYEL